MATTYTNLVQSIRDWSNRDAESLPTSVIQQCVRWAADTAYRELEVPPLEYTQEYVLLGNEDQREMELDNDVAGQALLTTTGGQAGLVNASLLIPADLTAFIQIRISGAAARNTDDDGWLIDEATGLLAINSTGIRSGLVFNEKTDVRTFHDLRSVKVSSFYWTRQQDNILIAGRLNAGDVIEVLYYRRLPSLDARYGLEAEDFGLALFPNNNGFSRFVDTGTAIAAITNPDGSDPVEPTADQVAVINVLIQNPSLSPNDFILSNGFFYAGAHIDHWLRDENERILIFGALNEAFGYLQEDDQAQKYLQKYLAEIQELNKEEKRRRASGGNTQVHFNSILI